MSLYKTRKNMDKSSFRIMLSGFDAESEKTYMKNIIERLKGTYLSEISNPQSYVSSCTHVVCKMPNRSEKYLAGCASGKWILTPYFLHDSNKDKQWKKEEEYEWGAVPSSLYANELQSAPKRWREKIKINHDNLPFRGWIVGLVMKEGLALAYTRIIEAGGGSTVDITYRYLSEVERKTRNEEVKRSLSHVLVTPKLAGKISRTRTEEASYLKAEYLAMYLLNDPPPKPELYSLFSDNQTNENDSQEKCLTSQSTSTTATSRSKSPICLSVTELASTPENSAIKSPTNHSLGEDIQRSSQTNMTPSIPKIKPRNVESSPTMFVDSARLTFAHSNQKTTDVTSGKSSTAIPNTVTRPAVVMVAANSPQKTVSSPSSSNQQRSLFKLFESARPIQLGGSPILKQPVLQLFDVKGSLSKLALSSKIKILEGKSSLEKNVPTISLGSKRAQAQPTTANKNRTDSTTQIFKTYYSDTFWNENRTIFKEFSSRKKQQNTSHGVFEKAFCTHVDSNALNDFRGRNARPFSRDVMTSLEASLEVNYKYGYFLKEVSSRITKTIYPTPDVIYVIMKAILLEAEDKNLANSAFSILERILELHPPQAPDIKSEKLYHKAFALMTVPDIDETSAIMLTIGDMLSRSNQEDWLYWCSRDATLGTLWTFYSRVFNLAIDSETTTSRRDGVKIEVVPPQKIHNSTLLTIFLTKLAKRDYQDVLSRNEYSSNSPMMKCLIADLLWPTMTGLEPWFRRPSPNLADMVALYVKSIEAYIFHLNAEESEDDTSVQSDGSDVDDRCGESEDNLIVLEQLSHLIAITSSWCVHCDVRDKERGKRTATRSLEAELVQTLRFELEEKNMKVLEIALEHMPTRLRLKVNVSLVQEICSDVLVPDSAKPDEELSLELITSRHMKMMPAVLPGEEKDSTNGGSSLNEDSGLERKHENPSGAKIAKSVSAGDVNKRNRKGETPLHIACMNDRPETVEHLLKQTGVNPNLTDYAGWTALGEACNHGHLECVRCLLELSIKNIAGADVESPTLCIDLTRCPSEGQTPLHDALGNGHLDIACLLLEKGGVQLLDKTDSEGSTPLDYCESEAARSYMIEYACNIAVKERQKRVESVTKKISKDEGNINQPVLTKLIPKKNYIKALPRESILQSNIWRDRVLWYFNVTCLLLSHYVTSCGLVHACLKTQYETRNKSTSVTGSTESSSDDVIIIDEGLDNMADIFIRHGERKEAVDVQTFANDVIFCIRWKDCWDIYIKHIKRLLGDNEDAINDVLEGSDSPIPIDLLI